MIPPMLLNTETQDAHGEFNDTISLSVLIISFSFLIHPVGWRRVINTTIPMSPRWRCYGEEDSEVWIGAVVNSESLGAAVVNKSRRHSNWVPPELKVNQLIYQVLIVNFKSCDMQHLMLFDWMRLTEMHLGSRSQLSIKEPVVHLLYRWFNQEGFMSIQDLKFSNCQILNTVHWIVLC